MTRAAGRGCGVAVAAALAAAAAAAAPVDVYRTGPQFCPRDRAAGAPPMSRAQAIQRARALLPPEFCGPARFVAGCDADTEFLDGAWRVYVHQFQLRSGRHDWSGLTHSYVILDAVGNCLANIPGTELGAPN